MTSRGTHTRPPDEPATVEIALRYAGHGWPVLPLHTPTASGCSCTTVDCGSPGKHPRTLRGLHDATTDPDQVRAWWTRWSDANVGVTTGATSKLLVVDIDLPDGPASLARLEADHGRLPATCQQRTGSGGRQLLFTHPGRTVANRTGLEPGIDIRGDGGYIVVPPSRHTSGERYRWVGHTPPAAAPAWLLTLLDRRRTPPHTAHDQASYPPLPAELHAHAYAAAALRGELARVGSAVEGSRNDTLNRAAFNLGQLVGAGLLDRDQVTDSLEAVASRLGLGATEIRRTIASGLSAGIGQPRPLPPVSSPPVAATTAPAARRIGARRR